MAKPRQGTMSANMLGVYLRHIKDPTALNALTSFQTLDIAKDQTHPFHFRIKRKLDEFDPKLLHWRVQSPVSLSKKRVIRDRAAHRLKSALIKQLNEAGLDRKGQPIRSETTDSTRHAQPLCGVAVIQLQHPTRFSIGPWADVEETAQAVYKKLNYWSHIHRGQSEVPRHSTHGSTSRSFQPATPTVEGSKHRKGPDVSRLNAPSISNSKGSIKNPRNDSSSKVPKTPTVAQKRISSRRPNE